MDDGFKQGDTYCIATNCFSEENISQFREFLLTKFNLETTMNNSHVIRIRNKSAIHFKELVSLYIHECLKYKL